MKMNGYDIKKIRRNLGLAIRYVRKKKDLTLSEVSSICETTNSTLSGIETGRIETVKFDMLLRICNALDITLEDLVSLCEKREDFWYG